MLTATLLALLAVVIYRRRAFKQRIAEIDRWMEWSSPRFFSYEENSDEKNIAPPAGLRMPQSPDAYADSTAGRQKG